jgi:hypothetical protein
MSAPAFLRVAPLNHYLEDMDIDKEHDNCIVPKRLWKTWVDQQTAEVLLVEVRQGDTRVILCVEAPQDVSSEHIYIPQRYFPEFEENAISLVTVVTTMPPLATKIELQRVDSELYHNDIAGAASKVLSNWNILKVGTVLMVPCEELGGYYVEVIVKSCEPADIVLLRGEVPLDIAEPLIKGPSWFVNTNQTLPYQPRPPTPIPEEPMQFSDEDFAQLVPTTVSQLGPARFTPFSGKGSSLRK